MTFQHLQHRLLHAAGVAQDLNNLNREGKMLLLMALSRALITLSPDGPPVGSEEAQKIILAGRLHNQLDDMVNRMSNEELITKITHLIVLIGHELGVKAPAEPTAAQLRDHERHKAVLGSEVQT